MLLLAMSPLGAPQRSEAFAYVTNGSFESGADGWTAPQATIFDVVDASVVPPLEGARSGRILIAPGGSLFSIRQTSWAGSPAGSYAFSAWIRTASPSTDVYAQATESNTGNTLHLTAPLTVAQWTEVSGILEITGSNNVVLTIGGAGSAGDVIYVDDVRFEGADPATMTPTATSTDRPGPTAPPGATATRTPTSTRTSSPTKTASVTAVPTTAPLPIGRQLRNTGFEAVTDDNLPEDWSKYGGTLHVSNASAHSGARAARLESTTNSTKWLYQTVVVDSGGAYEFGAWVLDDDANVASALLRISWYASDDGSGSTTGTSDSISRLTSRSSEYRHLTTGAVIAPGDARSARARIMLAPVSNAAAEIYADDASFDPAEPPASNELAAAAPAADAPSDANSPQPQALQASQHPSRSRASSADESSLVSSGISGPHPVLNEVVYDPDGAGADGAGEWVEIYNPTGASISLSGWSLADAASIDPLPAASVAPHTFIVIAASDSFRAAYPGFGGALVVLGGRIGNSLGNDGDRLVLRDSSGALVDAISWGTDASVLTPPIPDVPSGHSIERRIAGQDADAATDFVDNMHPSPGSAYAATTTAPPARTSANNPIESHALAPGGEPSFSWLPWALAGSAGAALLLALSWRAAPSLVQRLRQHP